MNAAALREKTKLDVVHRQNFEERDDAATPTTVQHVEEAQRRYVWHLNNAIDVVDTNTVLGKNFQLYPEVQASYRQLADLFRLRLDQVRESYEAQERQKAREADLELAKSNNELAKKQASLAEAQTHAAQEQVRIGRNSMRATWFAGLAALAAVLVSLLQAFKH